MRDSIPTPCAGKPPARSLPDVHPGCPGNRQVDIDLLLIHHGIKSFEVQHPEHPGKSVFLPWSKTVIGPHKRYVHRAIAGTAQVWWSIHSFGMPVWLYRKVRVQLLAGLKSDEQEGGAA